MKDKKNLLYVIIVVILAIILGVLWYLIISNTNSKSNSNSNNNGGPGTNNTSSATYSAVKEITKEENITSGEYESTNADENVISVSGNIKSTLSGIN